MGRARHRGQAGIRLWRKAKREAAKARREAKRELGERIFELYFAGRSSEEIAAELGGRSASAVRHFARVRGVTISRYSASVALLVEVSVSRRGALKRLAADLGTTPARVVGEILAAALGDDAAIGRGILRVRRREA
ncbi:hypothetical protein [Rhodoblastus sp.]|uniref:hypothetical protein n=1 Tax=Rhodoblastus sp. TaxID=1962975 RepID=UPI003F94BD26